MPNRESPRISPIAVRKALTITHLPFRVFDSHSNATTTESRSDEFEVRNNLSRAVTGTYIQRALAEAEADRRNGRWLREKLASLDA